MNLAMDVYDRTDIGDFEKPLEAVVNGFCYPMLPNPSQRHEKVSTVWGLVGAAGIEPATLGLEIQPIFKVTWP